MKKKHFPSLFLSADKLAEEAQKTFQRALKVNLITLIIAAILSFIPFTHWLIALLQLIMLLTTLVCSIYLATYKPEKSWYSGRALAESIKTLTWRYISKAEPFNVDDTVAKKEFLDTLNKAINQNREVCQHLSNNFGDEQITQVMSEMRAKDLNIRQFTYRQDRIIDQYNWYTQKASFNSTYSKFFFKALIFTNVISVILAAIKIAKPDLSLLPTDIFLTLAASILTWMQAKRFSELTVSYALAAHEISIIKSQSFDPMTEQEFSNFVGDTENAFSREHTQWIARKDI